MRIATWNVERRKHTSQHDARYAAAIEQLKADLIVVTEPGPDFISSFGAEVSSPCERPGGQGNESWVAIVGTGLRSIEGEAIPYERLATRASFETPDRRVALYGSVLPWMAARSQAPDVYGTVFRTFTQVFDRALQSQVDDVESLQYDFGRENVFWAGDFNHPLVGSLRGYSRHARAAIQDALEYLGMMAVNQASDHAKPGVFAIDLVCGPAALHYGRPESSMPAYDGKPLSDHRAYVVEVDWP